MLTLKQISHFTTWMFTSFAFYTEYCAEVMQAKFDEIRVLRELFDEN